VHNAAPELALGDVAVALQTTVPKVIWRATLALRRCTPRT
jgi:hypothetical protein